MRLVRTLTAAAALVLAALPTHATTYTPGEFVTFDASVWAVPADGFNAATLLETNFDAVFPQIPQPSLGYGAYLAIGVPNAAALLNGVDSYPPFSLILSDTYGSGGFDVQFFLGLATDNISNGGTQRPSRLTGDSNDFSNDIPGDGYEIPIPGGLLSADAIALTLNVDYSDHGLLAHPVGVPFGDLVFQKSRLASRPVGRPS